MSFMQGQERKADIFEDERCF